MQSSSLTGHESASDTAVAASADELFHQVAAAEHTLLPALSPPSEDEQAGFYNGLPSRPRLVGRASAGTRPWLSVEAPVEKCLANIGAHPIRTRWDKVCPLITMAVSRLPLTSIDVLRMCETDYDSNGEERIIRKPVVVWVGVEHRDIAWPLVAEALRACRFVLDAEQLSDVDVQIRVSQVFSLVRRTPAPV